MKKRILAAALSCLLLLGLLAGCASNSAPPAASPSTSSNITSPATASSSDPTPSASEEIKKVIVAFPTWSGPPADLGKVQDAINEISRAEIGVEVEFMVTDYASFQQQIILMLSGNEQVDIVVSLGGFYPTIVRNGQLIDLEKDDLLQTYGKGIIEQVGMTFIDACRMGGVLYGLPNNRDFAQGKGCFAVRTDLLEGIGYQFQNKGEIETGTMQDIETIFQKIHEKYPEMQVYRPVANAMQQYATADFLGGDVYGVLMDYGQNLDVVNFFETDYFKDYCEQLNKWYKAGYISSDAATDTTAVSALTMSGVLAAYNTAGKPGIKAQETNLCGYPMTIIQTQKDFISSSAVAGFPWCIPLNTADAVASMKFLNLMYTNADVMNLICWGIEGQHYVAQGDGLLNYPSGVDAKSSGYNHSMNWMFPNEYLLKVWNGDDPNLWSNMKTFNDNAEKSKALGFMFNSGAVSTEMTAVANVYAEYSSSLVFGLMDPATGIPELNSKLKAAGLDKIIVEKKAQLEQWLADKK